MDKGIKNSVTKFWAELRRRRVINTTGAYVIGAWVFFEVSSTVFPVLEFPDWTVLLVLVLLILGLPLVILLAWVFDIRREPEKAAKTALAEAAATDRTEDLEPSVTPPVLTSAIASVVVLPFENLSSSEEHKFIGDGIAAELHSALARVHRLRVAARTSSMVFAGSGADVKEIARKLNVKFVIGGSVRCIEDRLRVIVQLDNAVEGVQIWSATYDRKIDDLFSVQCDIANAVASAFGGARLRDEIANATNRPTASLDAWGLVQRARSYVLTFTPQVLADAVPLLRKAIDLDADYAAAHATLASTLSEQVLNGLSKDRESDRDEALRSADRAIAHSPSDPFVLKMCGVVWALFGKADMSLSALRRAVDISPFDFGCWGYMGWPLVETGVQQDLEELHEILDKILQATPTHPGVPFWLYHRSVAYICENKVDLAVEFAKKSVESHPTFPWGWMHYANSLARQGATEEAIRAIERSSDISPALTPEYYEFMIRGMSASDSHTERRLAGLRDANILSK